MRFPIRVLAGYLGAVGLAMVPWFSTSRTEIGIEDFGFGERTTCGRNPHGGNSDSASMILAGPEVSILRGYQRVGPS
jgi:hypothetical protein